MMVTLNNNSACMISVEMTSGIDLCQVSSS